MLLWIIWKFIIILKEGNIITGVNANKIKKYNIETNYIGKLRIEEIIR